MQYLSSLLLYIFLFLLPTQLGKHFFLDFSYIQGLRVDYLAPTLYLTDILALLLIIFNSKKIIALLNNKKLLVFFILLLLTLPFSLNKFIFLYRFLRIIEWLSIFFIFYAHRKKLNYFFILCTFTVGTVLQFTLAVTQFALKHSVQNIFYYLGERALNLSTIGVAKGSLQGIEFLRPYGTFSHPNSLGGFYLLLYFFVIATPQFNKKVVLKYFLLFLCVGLIFLSFSKIAILTFLILNIVYLITSRFYTRCPFCFTARALILLVLAGIVLAAKTDIFTVDKRVDLIKNATAIITQHPLVGVGLGNYVIAQSSFSSKYLNFLNQPVHNIVLLWIAETGLIVSAYSIYLIMQILRKNIKNVQFIFLIAVILITGFFDHYWLTLEQNSLLIAVLFGII